MAMFKAESQLFPLVLLYPHEFGMAMTPEYSYWLQIQDDQIPFSGLSLGYIQRLLAAANKLGLQWGECSAADSTQSCFLALSVALTSSNWPWAENGGDVSSKVER